ncbi:MAG: hypothetical protein ACXWUF_20350 [Methylomagnum sp.]
MTNNAPIIDVCEKSLIEANEFISSFSEFKQGFPILSRCFLKLQKFLSLNSNIKGMPSATGDIIVFFDIPETCKEFISAYRAFDGYPKLIKRIVIILSLVGKAFPGLSNWFSLITYRQSCLVIDRMR